MEERNIELGFRVGETIILQDGWHVFDPRFTLDSFTFQSYCETDFGEVFST